MTALCPLSAENMTARCILVAMWATLAVKVFKAFGQGPPSTTIPVHLPDLQFEQFADPCNFKTDIRDHTASIPSVAPHFAIHIPGGPQFLPSSRQVGSRNSK